MYNNESPILQVIRVDPFFGAYLSNKDTKTALGVNNDYQLRKFFDPRVCANPALMENQDFFYRIGEDRVRRIFFTFAGLIKLSDLLNTGQSARFKQMLIEYVSRQHQASHQLPAQVQVQHQTAQPGQPQTYPLATTPNRQYPWHQPVPHAQMGNSQVVNEWEMEESAHAGHHGPVDPAQLLAERLRPVVQSATDAAVQRVQQSQQSQQQSHAETAQSVASLLFHQQQLTANYILDAQGRMPASVHVERERVERVSEGSDRSWYSSWVQDPWAMTLIAVSVMALLGLSSYFFSLALLSAANRSQRPNQSPPVEYPVKTYPQ